MDGARYRERSRRTRPPGGDPEPARPRMPVRVTCPHCGTEHPSRVRARSRPHFASVNEAVGAVLERCPACRAASTSEPAERAWADPPPRRRAPA